MRISQLIHEAYENGRIAAGAVLREVNQVIENENDFRPRPQDAEEDAPSERPFEVAQV